MWIKSLSLSLWLDIFSSQFGLDVNWFAGPVRAAGLKRPNSICLWLCVCNAESAPFSYNRTQLFKVNFRFCCNWLFFLGFTDVGCIRRKTLARLYRTQHSLFYVCEATWPFAHLHLAVSSNSLHQNSVLSSSLWRWRPSFSIYYVEETGQQQNSVSIW